MLNFFAAIKKTPLLVLFVITLFTEFALQATAWAQAPLQPQSQPSTTNAGNDEEKYSYYATARLLSPDRKLELSTAEFKVNLKGTQTVSLKGRSLNVTLESEPNEFRRTQMVKVSASGSVGRPEKDGSTSFNAGVFLLRDRGEHSFPYLEKSRGWLLELRLRPLHAVGSAKPAFQGGKTKSPARFFPRKPKRLAA
jgi:hypothetical protein